MSQLELTVRNELEKIKGELAKSIEKVRSEISITKPNDFTNARPLTSRITSQHKYYRMHKKAKRTKIKITKDSLEIHQETEEITKELNIIQQTIEHQTEQQFYQSSKQTIYKQLASYQVQEESASTTYQLFELGYEMQLDVKQLVPDKVMDKRDLPTGLFGFTYLGSNYMAVNAKLDTSPALKEETMIHEAIHTNNEYETRVITWWMLSKDKKYAVLASKVADKQ